NLLILNRNILNDYENILVLVLGIYFIPSCIFSIYKYYEVNEFIKILVSKILFILILISYIVIYIYIFKILLTLTMPSNIVFRILSLLFIISMIVSIMSYDIENNNILIKINKLLPYLFIPFVFLQCYCLGIRIIDNGFTIFRYLGVMLIIFEIIYIIFHIINKDKSLLIFVIIFELVITLIIPFINCYDFSICSQYKYLLEYKNSNEVTNKVKSSYEYLNNFSKGKTLIKNLLTREQIDLINKYDFENNNFYYYDNNINLIDIEGYKTLEYIYENSDIEPNYPIIVEKMYNCYNGKVNDCFENNNIFILDNKKIIIKYANVDDNYYSIEYYLLKK
ncbi:MAG: DUF4153 domain-containing protein, partial [bacterium]|nr:DUF4153 domain-containing protein [bacterium]